MLPTRYLYSLIIDKFQGGQWFLLTDDVFNSSLLHPLAWFLAREWGWTTSYRRSLRRLLA